MNGSASTWTAKQCVFNHRSFVRQELQLGDAQVPSVLLAGSRAPTCTLQRSLLIYHAIGRICERLSHQGSAPGPLEPSKYLLASSSLLSSRPQNQSRTHAHKKHSSSRQRMIVSTITNTSSSCSCGQSIVVASALDAGADSHVDNDQAHFPQSCVHYHNKRHTAVTRLHEKHTLSTSPPVAQSIFAFKFLFNRSSYPLR